MARTAFRAAINQTVGWTVPSGKYAIFNMFDAGFPTIGALLNGNGYFYSDGIMTAIDRVGPFVANAGDIITGAVPASSGGLQGQFGIAGFYWDTSTIKTPFNQQILVNSTVYTVPAGKTAVFNAFTTWTTTPSAANAFTLLINGVQITSVFSGPGFLGSSIATNSNAGPFTANSGDVVSVGNYASPVTQSTETGCMAQLSGFLYPI